MDKIPFWARRKLISTFSTQEVGQIRLHLNAAGVSYHISQNNRSAPLGYGTGTLPLRENAPASVFEYTFYVYKEDMELAEAAINGSLG